MLSKKNKIYYWANSISKNDGEGILANNYLILLKKNFKNHSLINLNKCKNRENFVFKYILPFYGVVLLWTPVGTTNQLSDDVFLNLLLFFRALFSNLHAFFLDFKTKKLRCVKSGRHLTGF